MMMLIIKVKIWQRATWNICNPQEVLQMQPIFPYWVPNEKPQIIDALGTFEGPNKIGYSLPLEMPKHNPSHLKQHPICLPNSIIFKISSDPHHPPNHKRKILVLDCISLRDTWHNRKKISSFKKITIYTFMHSSFQCHKNCNQLTTQTHQTTRKKLNTQLPKLQKSFGT